MIGTAAAFISNPERTLNELLFDVPTLEAKGFVPFLMIASQYPPIKALMISPSINLNSVKYR